MTDGPGPAVDTAAELAASFASIAAARRFVRGAVQPVVPDEVAADLVLAVSELVTNAVEHGGPEPVHISVRVDDDQASVAVRSSGDHNRLTEVALWMPAAPDRPTGRGLAIVRRLADQVEVARSGQGVEITVRRLLG